MITIDDFSKVEIRIGRIAAAERMPDSEKLFRLSVDFGEESPRTVVSGIAPYFAGPEDVVGKRCAFVTNLEPRTIRGVESQAMILMAHDDAASSLLEVSEGVPPGAKIN